MNPEVHSRLQPPVSTLKFPPKMTRTISIYPKIKDKSINHILKKRFNKIHRIFLYSNVTNRLIPFQAPSIRRLTTSLNRLSHLSCLEIDLKSLPLDHYQAILVFFESLKHFKKIPTIHFFSSASRSPLLDNQKLLTLCKVIDNIRALPQIDTKLSLVIPFANLPVADSFRKVLESFVNHKRFTFLHLTLSGLSDVSQMEAIISIFKDSKSLSQLHLTLETNSFDSTFTPEGLLRSLKIITSAKNLKVCFTKCSDFSSNNLKYIASALKENTQVRNIEIIFEQTLQDISKFQWLLFVGSLKSRTHFQKVHVKCLDRLEILSMQEALFLFVVMSFGFLIFAAYILLGMNLPFIIALIAILVIYATVLSESILA